MCKAENVETMVQDDETMVSEEAAQNTGKEVNGPVSRFSTK